MKKIFCTVLAFVFMLLTSSSEAQYSSQNDAKYLATLKAVVNFKIDDEENRKDVEALRKNKAFNTKLINMLSQLSNDRTKNSKNKQVLDILEQAGKDIYNILE